MPGTASPPRERLSREAVIAGALALADREGLAAVTIRRLAGEAGVTPMALYWHVKDKDELLDGMGQQLFAEVALPPSHGEPWDVELRAVLTALLVALRRHPAAAGLAMTTVLTSDAGLVVAERALGLLCAAGLGAQEAAETGQLLLASMVTMVTAQPGDPGAEETAAARRHKRALLGALEPGRFPYVVRLAEHLTHCDTGEYDGRGVDVLVSGIVARVAAARA